MGASIRTLELLTTSSANLKASHLLQVFLRDTYIPFLGLLPATYVSSSTPATVYPDVAEKPHFPVHNT